MAVGSNENSPFNSIIYSYDLITWTSITIPMFVVGNDISYGNEIFVAVGQKSLVTYTNTVAFSNNGYEWFNLPNVLQNNGVAVTFGNNMFVVLDQYGYVNSSMSSDLNTWSGTQQIFSSSIGIGGISLCFGNNIFAALGVNGSKQVLKYSTDGQNWTIFSSAYNIYSLNYINNMFVVCTYDISSDSYVIITTLNFIDWSEQYKYILDTYDSNGYLVDISYGNGKYIATDFYTNGIFYSTDLKNWTKESIPNGTGYIYSVDYITYRQL